MTTTGQTAELLAEVQALIRQREHEGVRGLADRVGPAPLITTLVDRTGLVIYFTIARILLSL
jgi:hypothetical protein